MKKFILTLIGLAVLFLVVGCGGGGREIKKALPSYKVKIKIDFPKIGKELTFQAIVPENIEVVQYNWTGDLSGDAETVKKTFEEGNYTVSLKVIDANGVEANTSKSFVVKAVAVERTYLEEFFNLDNLSVGDSFYWNGSAWEKTEESCVVEYTDDGKVDFSKVTPSSLRSHHTIVLSSTDNNGEDFLLIYNCSMDNNYSFGPEASQYKDMQVLAAFSDRIEGGAFADYNSPDDFGWIKTPGEIMDKQKYPYSW